MNLTLIIIFGMLVLSIAAPFVSLYAISFIRKKEYSTHIKIQKRLFWLCLAAVVIFEVHIRISGGSGSLIANSEYTSTTFFKNLLTAHIIGAILTYIIWGVAIFTSDKKWKNQKTFPGKFTLTHRRLGYFTITGLFYTAISAVIVCTFAFVL